MDAIRTVAPVGYPVTLDEAKQHLRVDQNDDDALIEAFIAAATDHLDGPDGILGRAILPQTWREKWDAFQPMFPLRFGPAGAIVSMTYTDSSGAPQSIIDARLAASLGVWRVAPALGGSWPSGSDVSIEYAAGSADVPAPLKVAILLHVGSLYENRESISGKPMSVVPLAYEMLIMPYRRVLV